MKRRRRVAGWVFGAMATYAGGQTHKVTRPETVVRAVGVYEWTGDLTKPKGERLVPVTIFIDGQVQDAGVYLARPIPMALGPGTVYELDDAGVEKGLLDLKEARHVQIPAAADATPYDDGWFGYGVFEAPKPPKPVATKKVTQQVAVNGKVGVPDAGSPEDVKVDAGSGEKDDVDRPTLRRRTPVDPKDAKKARKERELSSVTPEKGSLNDDPDRPRMKRNTATAEDEMAALNGLPADMKQMVAVSDPKRREPHPFARAWEDEAEHQAVLGQMRAMAQKELVAYGPVPPGTPVVAAAASASPAAGSSPTVASPAGGLASQDTSGGNAPVLRRNKVAADAPAKEQVTAAPIVTAPAAAPKAATAKAATTTGKTAAARRAGAKAKAEAGPAAGTVLVDEEVKGFTLSYGGAPTYVYTAHTVGEGAARRYVTIVGQQDGPGGPREALHAVTDAAHLDRTPWMRFVDVVDVEASNRASLLFELRGQTSRQFAVYRVLGGRTDALFTGGTTQ